MTKKSRTFQPRLDSLEERVMLNSHLLDRAITEAEVISARLSRNQIRDVIASQIRGAYSEFAAGFEAATHQLETSLNTDAFDLAVANLVHTLDIRVTTYLSTSPRAFSSLIPYLHDQVGGIHVESLSSKLSTLHVHPDNPNEMAEFHAAATESIAESFQAVIFGLNRFAQRPNFTFPTEGTFEPPTDPPTQPEPPPPATQSVRFDAASYTVDEDAGPAEITITRSSGDGTLTVNVNTVDGTAQAGVRYERVSETLTFQPGEMSKVVSIPIIDTTSFEGDQTVNLRLTSPVGGQLGSPSTAVLTIVDDETAPLPPEPTEAFLLEPLSIALAHGAGIEMHDHPRLRIFINDEPVVIPANTGVMLNAQGQPTDVLPMHTHDTTGILHVESPERRTFRLDHWFFTWRETTNNPDIVFNSENLLGNVVDENHRIVMTVNGEPSTEFEELILRDLDDIVIRYEPIT